MGMRCSIRSGATDQSESEQLLVEKNESKIQESNRLQCFIIFNKWTSSRPMVKSLKII